MTAPVLREHPEPYAQALCGLPDCHLPLHLERSIGQAVYLSDTAKDLACGSGHTSSWQVTCEAGHVVLLPVDTAGDNYTFGECALHDQGEQHDDSCDDLARLRAVLSPGAVVA